MTDSTTARASDDHAGDDHADVIVIGAGMAGLRAAGLLAATGRHVIVVDKGRRHGGRMATRRVDDATFDTGAIAFTARSDAFVAHLSALAAEGHARTTAPPSSAVLEETWRGSPMMRSLPAALSAAIEAGSDQSSVRLATQVTSVTVGAHGWDVTTVQDGSSATLHAAALIITAPAPQSLSLLGAEPGLVSATTLSELAAVVYAPSLTVLARPIDRTLTAEDVPAVAEVGPGTAAPDIDRVHRNESTGASPVVALTIQMTPAFSSDHLDGDRATAARSAADQASAALGVPLEVVHVHGWRYAQVLKGIDVGDRPPVLLDTSSGARLVIAGDLIGPSVRTGTITAGLEGVERAYLSGTAAAGSLL
jgi:predicted NAD/FAD-dependent oxidoreductase